jgi:hypothetical protein
MYPDIPTIDIVWPAQEETALYEFVTVTMTAMVAYSLRALMPRRYEKALEAFIAYSVRLLLISLYIYTNFLFRWRSLRPMKTASSPS